MQAQAGFRWTIRETGTTPPVFRKFWSECDLGTVKRADLLALVGMNNWELTLLLADAGTTFQRMKTTEIRRRVRVAVNNNHPPRSVVQLAKDLNISPAAFYKHMRLR